MANKKTAKILSSDVKGSVSTTTVFETKLNDIEKALKELKGLHQNYLDRYEKNTKKYNENIEIIGKSMDKANDSLQKDVKAFKDLTEKLNRATSIVEGSTVDTLDAVDMQKIQLNAIQELIERTYKSWNELDSKVAKINTEDTAKQVVSIQKAIDASNKIIIETGTSVADIKANTGDNKGLHKTLKEISTSLAKLTYDVTKVNKNVLLGTKYTSNLGEILDEIIGDHTNKINNTLKSITTSQSHTLQGLVDIHQKSKDTAEQLISMQKSIDACGGKSKCKCEQKGWFTRLIDSIF